MKRFVATLSAVLAFAVPSVALACEEHNAAVKKAEVQKVTVAELTKLQKAKTTKVVDANGQETRSKVGVIPGAILLTSAAKFDATKELSGAAKDSKLVFYCYNTSCTASETAAKRALEAGYTDVAILPEGIMGWKDAGKKLETPRS